MSEEDRARYYRLLAEQVGGVFDTVPEPEVGKVFQRNIRKNFLGAETATNNAGMRDHRPYLPKPQGIYRIVCLGDSFVMGAAGAERDRWGNQIEDILRELGVKVDGRPVEVYSVGVGTWTMANAATYLASRITEYDPDLVLGLMSANDMTDGEGLNGVGHVVPWYSIETRRFGSGNMYQGTLGRFGFPGNLLDAGIGPESRAIFDRTFEALARLERLQEARGKRMILGILQTYTIADILFHEQVKVYHEDYDMSCPMIFTSYFDEPLPHDWHPNRQGHRIIAAHYLHTLAELGWLPVERDDLPPLHEYLDLKTSHTPDLAVIDREVEAIVSKHLNPTLNFGALNEENALAMLGGFYPLDSDRPLADYPFATVKTAFLLEREENSDRVALEIDVPDRVELFPFSLTMHLDGKPAARLELASRTEAGRHTLSAELPPPPPAPFDRAVEVMLRTDAYFTRIDDPTMLSYQVIEAKVE